MVKKLSKTFIFGYNAIIISTIVDPKKKDMADGGAIMP